MYETKIIWYRYLHHLKMGALKCRIGFLHVGECIAYLGKEGH
jgi:hypothetical protein